MLLSKFSNPSSTFSFPSSSCLPPRKPTTGVALIRPCSPQHVSRRAPLGPLSLRATRCSPHRLCHRAPPGSLSLRVTRIRAERRGDGPPEPPGDEKGFGGKFKGFRFPAMTKKPRWWWRTLACLPYLMPLHHSWVFAETAYHMHPFPEEFEFVTYPFLTILARFPKWFPLAYFILGYLLIVRRKEWPHFLRFHVILGLLIEIGLQINGFAWKRLPVGLYWGKLGMAYWCFYFFAHLFTTLECIRCAICGMYADVPGFADAAYIQVPYD